MVLAHNKQATPRQTDNSTESFSGLLQVSFNQDLLQILIKVIRDLWLHVLRTAGFETSSRQSNPQAGVVLREKSTDLLVHDVKSVGEMFRPICRDHDIRWTQRLARQPLRPTRFGISDLGSGLA